LLASFVASAPSVPSSLFKDMVYSAGRRTAHAHLAAVQSILSSFKTPFCCGSWAGVHPIDGTFAPASSLFSPPRQHLAGLQLALILNTCSNRKDCIKLSLNPLRRASEAFVFPLRRRPSAATTAAVVSSLEHYVMFCTPDGNIVF